MSIQAFALASPTSVGSGSGTLLADTFQPPGPESFQLGPLFSGVPWLDKPMLFAFVALVGVAAFYISTSRRAALVPGRWQFAGEMAYSFVRNNIARDMIGEHDFRKFVPYLVAVFSFILVNNVFGVIPIIQFPTFSHVGWAYAFAAVSWVVYNAVGIGRHGFFGYLKHVSVPSGVPLWILPILAPIEFMSNILVRPLTLSLRLFANMFAGHLVLLVFTLGGAYLLTQTGNIGFGAVGVVAYALGVLLTFLELLVQVLQAYIFTVLTASYISTSLAEDH